MNSADGPTTIEGLLARAEDLLWADAPEHLALLERDPWATLPAEGYRRARELFERVRVADPQDERAAVGIACCDQVLEPYVPVQRMSSVATAAMPPLAAGPSSPWEFRAGQRGRDLAGLRYTAKVCGEVGAAVKRRIEEMVAAAAGEIAAGADPAATADGLRPVLERLVEDARLRLKGVGPDLTSLVSEALARAGLVPRP